MPRFKGFEYTIAIAFNIKLAPYQSANFFQFAAPIFYEFFSLFFCNFSFYLSSNTFSFTVFLTVFLH